MTRTAPGFTERENFPFMSVIVPFLLFPFSTMLAPIIGPMASFTVPEILTCCWGVSTLAVSLFLAYTVRGCPTIKPEHSSSAANAFRLFLNKSDFIVFLF